LYISWRLLKCLLFESQITIDCWMSIWYISFFNQWNNCLLPILIPFLSSIIMIFFLFLPLLNYLTSQYVDIKRTWHRHLFHSKYICPLLFLTSRQTSSLFPFPTSPQYFSLICDPFADPMISLHSRDISLYDCHI
jgi:hypothetical protein